MNPHRTNRAMTMVKISSLPSARRGGISLAVKTSLAISALLLTGCMRNTPPSLAQHLPEQWQHPIAVSALPAPDLHVWWKSFHAPDLDILIDQSLAQNLTLAAAREHIYAARILSENNPNKFRPDVHFRTGDMPSPSAANSYFRAGLDSSWELGLFGKQSASQQIVQGELLGVQAQAQMARVSLIAEVVRTWVALRSAQQQVLILNQIIAQTQQQIVLGEQRVELGLGTRSAVLPFKSAQSRQIQSRFEKQLEIDQAIEQLALLQGREIADPALATFTAPPVIADFSIGSIPADLMRIRPDIKQAEASVIQAAGQLGVAKAERYPSITLAGSYMYSVQLLGKFSFSKSSIHGVGSFGPEIDIPLFDWGQRQAKANAQGAELKAAVLTYRQTVLEAAHEVESAIANVNTQKERASEQSKEIKAAQQTLSEHQSLLHLGLANTFDRLDIQQALLQSQLEFAEINKAHNLAYIAMYKALGGAPVENAEALSTESQKNLRNQTATPSNRLGG